MKGRIAVGAALAIAAVIAWVLMRGGDDRARSSSAPAASHSIDAAAAAASAIDARPAPTFRRFADALDRQRAIAAIEAARSARSRSTGSAGSATRPSLAEPPPLTSDQVLAGLMDVLPLMEECYRDAIPRLPNPRGRLHVKLTLSGEPDIGTVIDDAALTSDDPLIKDDELVRCMHETLMSVELPPIPEGGEAGFAVDLQLSPDEPTDADAGAGP